MGRRRSQRRQEIPIHLAVTLRAWREQNGWPLKKVADEFGVTKATWSRWESGERFPSPIDLQLLSDFLHVPVCRFFAPPDHPCHSCCRRPR